MRVWWLLAFAVIAAPVAGATDAPPSPADLSTASEQPADQITTANDFARRMTVPVTVNGVGPFAFLVDTGSNHTVVSDRLATTLRLPGLPERVLVSVTGPEPVSMAALESIEVGGLRHDGVDAAVIAEEPLGAIGILGIDSLAGRQVVLDFRKHLMTISGGKRSAHADSHEPPGTIVVTARRQAGQLILTDAYFRGHRIDLVLDTGAEISIGNLAFLDLIARHSPDLPITTVTGVTGKSASVKLAKLPQVYLDKLSLNDTFVVFGDLPCFRKFGLADKPAMLLGMDVLRQFDRIAIDFQRRRVAFSLPHDDDAPFYTKGV